MKIGPFRLGRKVTNLMHSFILLFIHLKTIDIGLWLKSDKILIRYNKNYFPTPLHL